MYARSRYHSAARRMGRAWLFCALALAAACGEITSPTAPTSPQSLEVALPTGRLLPPSSPLPALTHLAQGHNTAAAVHQLGDFVLYMPAAPDGPNAVIVALGGPRTSAIVTGGPFGAPPPVEPILALLGQAMRDFADEHRVAILGTSRFGPSALPNEAASDALILGALADGAVASGHPELADAPILLFGMSGGGPEASGFAARLPERVAGVFLKAPVGVASPLTGEQRMVPTFLALAETDVFVDNSALSEAFTTNRADGALWALAIEPGTMHFSWSNALRSATIGWMRSIIGRRVAGSSGRIQEIPVPSGWLGDPSSRAVSPWGRYGGDRDAASWFPTKSVADYWRILLGAATGP